MDCCLDTLALPALEDFGCCQKWSQSSSFCDLDVSVTDSGSPSWLGCDLLLETEEYSSKLLSQQFGLAPPVAATAPHNSKGLYGGCAAATLHSPFGVQQQEGRPVRGASPATSVGTLDAADAAAPSSPAVARCQQQSQEQQSLLHAGSRAGTPEADWQNEEAVCLAGLALHLSQGDANGAMAQLLHWAAAQ